MTKIIRPKLEKNYKPSEWSPCSIWSSSLIKQTAEAVTIQVEQEIQGLSGLTQRVGTLEVTASAITQDVQALSATTTGMTQQIGNLTVKSDSISASVTTLQEKVAGVNLFPLNGWIDSNNKFVEVYGNDIEYSGSTNSTAITSPNVWLEVGDYTLSVYESSNHALHEKTGTIQNTNYTVMSGLENQFKNIYRDYANIHISTAGNYQFYINSNNFFRPKLESGLEPTPYSNQNIDHHSLIEQTDSSISLKVVEEVEDKGLVNEVQLKETGIDIRSGEITLNADKTTINGNLSLNDADQGLKVYQSGIEKISIANESLSSLEDYNFGSIDRPYIQGETNIGSFVVYANLGTFKNGETIRLHDTNIDYKLDNDPFGDNNGNCQVILTIVDGGSNNITGWTYNFQEADYNPLGWEINDILTHTLTGYSSPTNITLRVTVTPTFKSQTGATKLQYRFYTYSDRQEQSGIRLGNDGAIFANDTTHYNWMGSDKTVFKQGQYEVRISNSGITKSDMMISDTPSNDYSSGKFGEISTTIPVNRINATAYTATVRDGLIIFSTVLGTSDGANRRLTLPDPKTMPLGKWFKIKNIVGNNTTVTCAISDAIIPFDTYQTTNQRSIGDNTFTYVNEGFFWIEMGS